MDPIDVLTARDPWRIARLIREHEKLARQVRALTQLLKEKGTITQDDFARLMEITRESE